MKTEANEQRKTEWIDTQSLEDFLDPNDPTKTIEGYLGKDFTVKFDTWRASSI